MSKDYGIELADAVHNVVASSTELMEAIDQILAIPADVFEIPRSTVVAIRVVLGTSTLLTTKMYEQNQDIVERVEKVAKKFVEKVEKEG